MSDSSKEVRISFRVCINKEKTKVLFAEVGNDFADVLLSFFLLPLGKIVKIFEKHYGDKAPAIGSLTTLYKSLSSPKPVNFLTVLGKTVRNVSSSSSEHCRLKLTLDHMVSTSYEYGQSYDGVFTSNAATFIISDDLRIVPNIIKSYVHTLSIIGVDVKDLREAETKTVTFGLKEFLELLKGSFDSCTLLSDIILCERQTEQTKSTTEKEPAIFTCQVEKEAAAKEMILVFQKSTRKLLFAQADDDFINFLFSILLLPVGIIESLLGGNSGLTNIDNLYRTTADYVHEKHLKCLDKKDQLMNPQVPEIYTIQNFLPICEGQQRQQQARRSFVERACMYMVTDDLTVTTLGVMSIISFLNEKSIPQDDTEEVKFQIGTEEALSILKASLTSSCALTDGLVDPSLKKKGM